MWLWEWNQSRPWACSHDEIGVQIPDWFTFHAVTRTRAGPKRFSEVNMLTTYAAAHLADAKLAEKYGASAIGFNFHKASARYISMQQAGLSPLN